MKTTLIQYCSIIAIAITLTACGGGKNSASDPSTQDPNFSPGKQSIKLSNIVDIVVSEKVDSVGKNLVDIDNFLIEDDIDGDVLAEDKIDALVEALLAAQNANP